MRRKFQGLDMLPKKTYHAISGTNTLSPLTLCAPFRNLITLRLPFSTGVAPSTRLATENHPFGLASTYMKPISHMVKVPVNPQNDLRTWLTPRSQSDLDNVVRGRTQVPGVKQANDSS